LAGSLRRVLGLKDLILYGIILIMPIAPVPLYGVAQKLSQGHAVTTILLAMVAMTLTAFSYGRMAAKFPAAGSAYTYVGRGLNPHLGFLAGWAMIMDYLLVPLICTVYGALTIQRLVPAVPYAVWAAILAGAMTVINLRGIRATANANLVLMIAMMVVILAFMGLAVRWLFHAQGWPGLFSIQPFYDPQTFHWKSIMTGTSLAALTYGGFDGVSTLSEDVENPRRNILLATVFVCLFTGIFGGLQVYLAQRISPGMGNLTNLETAFIDITRIVGGPILFTAMAVILIIANLGCGLSAVAGVSRLLYGMGRDHVLPAKVFGHLDEKRGTPVYNILLVGLFTYIASLCLNYERAAELINFGAFIAFMGVNAAVIRQFYFLRSRAERRMLTDVLLPGAGFLFCFAIWLSLPTQAKLLGCFWFSLGLIWSAIQTRGFRIPPMMVSFEEV
jgi:putrescine importer